MIPTAPTTAITSAQIGSCPLATPPPPPALTTVGTVSDSGVLGSFDATAGSGVMSGTAIAVSAARGDPDASASINGTMNPVSVGPSVDTAGAVLGVVVGVLDGAEVGVVVGVGEGVTTEMICVGQDALLIQSAPAAALTPA